MFVFDRPLGAVLAAWVVLGVGFVVSRVDDKQLPESAPSAHLTIDSLSRKMGDLTEESVLQADARLIGAITAPPPLPSAPPIDGRARFATADGQWLEGATLIDRKPLWSAREARRDVQYVRRFGDFALVHGMLTIATDADERASWRYTHAYQRRSDQWWFVGGQHTRVRATVIESDSRLVPNAALDHWQEKSPAETEEHALRILNEQYVDAFRRADVAWYDAHLAPDYLVVYSDGSLNSRETALAHFARPVFATQLRNFPVDRVRVNQFGDAALIHAENAYELKDGRRGIDRYTDIWLKRFGRWFCVAAHITTRIPAS